MSKMHDLCYTFAAAVQDVYNISIARLQYIQCVRNWAFVPFHHCCKEAYNARKIIGEATRTSPYPYARKSGIAAQCYIMSIFSRAIRMRSLFMLLSSDETLILHYHGHSWRIKRQKKARVDLGRTDIK